MIVLRVAETEVRQDTAGRFCLNDLHRASGGAVHHQPGKFMALKRTAELVEELRRTSPNSETPHAVVNDGTANGTYVVKPLVYAYAMWVSAKFNLRVIEAYDRLVSAPVTDPLAALNDPAQMRRLLLNYADRALALEAKVAAQAPQVAALVRLSAADGDLCVTSAAKSIQVPPSMLFAYLRTHGWIYRRPGARADTAYQTRLASGYLRHRVTTIEGADGTRVVEQVLVTPKGLAKLAECFAKTDLVAGHA